MTRHRNLKTRKDSKILIGLMLYGMMAFLAGHAMHSCNRSTESQKTEKLIPVKATTVQHLQKTR